MAVISPRGKISSPLDTTAALIVSGSFSFFIQFVVMGTVLDAADKIALLCKFLYDLRD